MEETQLVLRLAGALMDFWGAKGYIAEGRRRLEAALADDQSPTAARAKALNAASLAIGGADVATSRARASEALELHRQLGDDWGVAGSLYLLGNAAADDQDFKAAKNLWEESLQLWRQVGDSFFALLAMRMLAWAYRELGDADRARSLIDDVLEQARAAGYKHLQVHALESIAHDAAPHGHLTEAASLLKKAYELNRELGDRSRDAIIVCRFARVLAYAGQVDTAARLLGAGEALYEEMGASPMAWLKRGNDQALALISARLDNSQLAHSLHEGRKLPADAAIALALDDLGINN
jgi:tetratricopeptide (TPR) repeat protein